MLRQILLAAFVCLSVQTVYAQRNGNDGGDDDGKPDIQAGNRGLDFVENGYGGLQFEFGWTNIRPFRTNTALFGRDGFMQFYTVGLTESQTDGPVDGGYSVGSDQCVSLHWFLSQEDTATAFDGDHMKYRMKGWELMTSSYGMDLIPSEHLDLVVGVGVFWGNLKLRSENVTEGTGTKLYKNPFVAPMVRSELRVQLGAFCFGGRFSYRYDITKDNWKRKDDGLNPLPGYQFREMQYIVYIGFRFPLAEGESDED